MKGLLGGLDICKVSLSFPLFLIGENGLKPGSGGTASALRDSGMAAEVRDGDGGVRGRVEGFLDADDVRRLENEDDAVADLDSFLYSLYLSAM